MIASGQLSRTTFDKFLKTSPFPNSAHLKDTLLELTLVFIRKCLEDHKLSDAEMMELQALTTIFRIEEGDFYKFRPAAVQQLVTAQAEWILRDRYVTEQEEVLQCDLRRLFGLSYDHYVTLLRPVGKKYIDELKIKRRRTRNDDELDKIESSIQNLRSVFLIDK